MTVIYSILFPSKNIILMQLFLVSSCHCYIYCYHILPKQNTHPQNISLRINSISTMTSSSNSQVSAITNKTNNAIIRDICARQMRRAAGTKTAIVKSVDEWSTTLIRKLHCKDPIETDVVRKETKLLWSIHRTKEFRGLDKNIYLFKFHIVDSMNAVKSRGPWNVKKCHLNL